MNVREWALPVYTILMQLAVGSLLTLWLMRAAVRQRYGRSATDLVMRLPILAICLTILTAIVGAHFHLSQSYFSLLAVLNWRTSWLSREVIFTILFFASATSLAYLLWFKNGQARLITSLGWVSLTAGGLVVYSMSKIYLLPTQASWNTPLTLYAFFLTTLLLGVTAVSVLLVMDLNLSEVAGGAETAVRRQLIQKSFVWLAATAFFVAGVILALNLLQIKILNQGDAPAQTSLLLLLGLYQPLFALRFITLFTGVSWFSLTAFHLQRRHLTPLKLTNPIYLACLLVLIAEITGRFLFYAKHVRLGI
ncbi:MAG: DMSO reductase subunit C [Ardenticatenaceae bacterium]|nr:MAG: DMSO reductase subunit C [Ardenticatenaceae bacterium]